MQYFLLSAWTWLPATELIHSYLHFGLSCSYRYPKSQRLQASLKFVKGNRLDVNSRHKAQFKFTSYSASKSTYSSESIEIHQQFWCDWVKHSLKCIKSCIYSARYTPMHYTTPAHLLHTHEPSTLTSILSHRPVIQTQTPQQSTPCPSGSPRSCFHFRSAPLCLYLLFLSLPV